MNRNRSRIERWFSSELFAAVLIVIGIIIFALATILFLVSGYFDWLGNIGYFGLTMPPISVQTVPL